MLTARDSRWPWLLGACALVLVLGPWVSGEQAATSNGKVDAKKPETAAKPGGLKVEVGPIKVDVTLKGVVEAKEAVEVSLKPEAWALPLTVERAVEHGTPVKAGDILVELDLEKIDQAIKDLRVERELAEVVLKHADEELPVLEKLLPLDLLAAERLKVRADEDLARFLEIDKPLARESAEFQAKSSGFYLEYAQDELTQLQKMYRAKDLTEETEQLILKRHKFDVESAQFRVKNTQIANEQTFKITLPRREESAREEAARQALLVHKARTLLPLEIQQKRLSRDKLRYEKDKSDEKLAQLERDRKAMTVRSPGEGIVYYGKAASGQWNSSAIVAPKLQKGGVLAPLEVFMTIVVPRPAFVRASVEEKDLHAVRPRAEGKATPAGFPDLKLPARVVSVSTYPQTPGNFDARLDVDLGPDAAMIVPGMACTIKLVSYRKDDALTVPATAVFSDDDDETHYVYRLPRDEEAESEARKRTVKVGKTAGGKTEILEGLRKGDEILGSKP